MSLAKCAYPPHGCGCFEGERVWAWVGPVSAGSDGGTELSSGTRFGAAPDVVPVNELVGRTVLATQFGTVLPVDNSGNVHCAGVTLDALSFAAAISEGKCEAELAAAGYRQPPCHDTFPFCGCGATPELTTLLAVGGLLGTWGRRRMRRRPG
jgi:hypothetical protein